MQTGLFAKVSLKTFTVELTTHVSISKHIYSPMSIGFLTAITIVLVFSYFFFWNWL